MLATSPSPAAATLADKAQAEPVRISENLLSDVRLWNLRLIMLSTIFYMVRGSRHFSSFATGEGFFDPIPMKYLPGRAGYQKTEDRGQKEFAASLLME